jgi:FkbM family methyltransferase
MADLVKIDVEGAEFKVLKGAKKALNQGKIKQLDSHPRIFGALP